MAVLLNELEGRSSVVKKGAVQGIEPYTFCVRLNPASLQRTLSSLSSFVALPCNFD